MRYFPVMKRLLDLLLAIVLLMVLSPLFLILVLVIWIRLGRPVFFTQERPGKGGKSFRMIKFRTMRDDRDSSGNLLPDHLRTPRVGRIIRKTSLDELPEIINILRGDMSLVGPRPLLMKYLPYYTEREKKRHLTRPGITGLAQVSGRNLLSWDERLETDVQYVEQLSFRMDIVILFRTIIHVIRQKDALAVSSEVIPDFDDYRKAQQAKSNDH